MKYDFTSILNRKGMDAIAVDALGHGTAPGAPEPASILLFEWSRKEDG